MEYLKLDTLVELQDQYSNVYPASPTGARGWVRARRELQKTDPEVYIEWDKNHWRYHGEKDGWTFEHHFRAVPEPEAPPAPDMTEILARAHRQVDAERCSNCGDFHNADTQFLDTLMEAQEAALGSEGYFMISLTPRADGDATIYEPLIHSEVLNDTAKRMIETQLIHVAMQIFEQHLIERVNDLEGPNRRDD